MPLEIVTLLLAAAPGGDMTNDRAFLHDLSPVLVELGPLPIRWYGLSYIAGFLAGYLLLLFLAAKGATRLPREAVGDAVTLLILGVVVGGRLGYAAFYDPSLIWTFTGNAPWWALLNLTNGGMASHGGMIGVLLACVWIARRHRLRFLDLSDALALACVPGLLFGRLANFINGELLGVIRAAPGEAAPWWAVRYPQEIAQFEPEALPQTEAQWAGIQALVERYGSYEGVLDALRHGTAAEKLAVREELPMLISARYPSQLVQAATDGLLVGLVVWIIAARPRTVGVVSAAFGITYGLGRFATEFVRLPDEGVSRWLGLTRGQWLSALVLAAGVAVLAAALQKRGDTRPGWLNSGPKSQPKSQPKSGTGAASEPETPAN